MKVQMSSEVTASIRCWKTASSTLDAFGRELLHREDVVGVADHHHDVLELRQPGADLADLRELLLVLDDDHLGVGVLEHVGALLR